MTIAITVGLLVFGAVYLMFKPEMLRIILGFVLLGHAANMIIMAAGGASRRDEPFGTWEDPATAADPLPQAFVLTAIVIAFSITMVLLVLAVTGRKEDDIATIPVDEGADHDAGDHEGAPENPPAVREAAEAEASAEEVER